MKKDKTTRLMIWLSNGVKVIIWFKGEISDSIYEELENLNCWSFFVQNWEVKDIAMYDRRENLIFTPKANELSCIDYRKIIGWNIE